MICLKVPNRFLNSSSGHEISGAGFIISPHGPNSRFSGSAKQSAADGVRSYAGLKKWRAQQALRVVGLLYTPSFSHEMVTGIVR